MNPIIFTVPGPPQGKSRARTVANKYTGKSVSYTPDKTVLYEKLDKRPVFAKQQLPVQQQRNVGH